MFLKTVNRARVRLALCLILLMTTLTGTVAFAGENRTAKVRMAPEDCKYFEVQVNNCTLMIEPADDTQPEVHFDTGALRIQQSVNGETLCLTIESHTGKVMGFDAAATLYVPRSLFNALMMKTLNGELMLMGGIASMQDITADNSRVSVQYTGSAKGYSMSLSASTCDFSVPDTATDYRIIMNTHKGAGGNYSLPGDETWLIRTDGRHQYPMRGGEGEGNVSVDLMNNSNFNVRFSRTAN